MRVIVNKLQCYCNALYLSVLFGSSLSNKCRFSHHKSCVEALHVRYITSLQQPAVCIGRY